MSVTSAAGRKLREAVVVGLVRACTLSDRLTPDWRWHLPGRVCRLAEWSYRLDERWGVDYWQPPVGKDVAR